MNISEKKEMKSLVECLENVRQEGYTEDFIITSDGLSIANQKKNYQPTEVKICSFYRFEGESDPDDNSILYSIETNDGIKGVLTDAYGVYADEKVSKFIGEVQRISKKPQ